MKDIYSSKNLVFRLLAVATITLTIIILAVRNRCDSDDDYSQTDIIKATPIFQLDDDELIIPEGTISENLIESGMYISTFTPSKDQKMTNQEILLELIRIYFDGLGYLPDYRINYILVYNPGIVRIYYDVKPKNIDDYGNASGNRFGDWWIGIAYFYEILKTGEQYYFYGGFSGV